MPKLLDTYQLIKLGKLRVPYHGSPNLRFWAQVDKNGPIHPVVGQCWVWTGARWKKTGYGQIKISGRRVKTHRFSYELLVGEITSECVLHRCDNPICVNPSHLFLGSFLDNVVDMVSKCRQAIGSGNGNAVLTEDIVAEIRQRYKKRSKVDGQKALAKEFGVGRSAIGRVINGELWKHVS